MYTLNIHTLPRETSSGHTTAMAQRFQILISTGDLHADSRLGKASTHQQTVWAKKVH